MKIVTICGMGLGTSLMLKMNIENILKSIGKSAQIDNVDLGSIKGINADLVIAPKDMESRLKDVPLPKIFINNLIDKLELEQRLKEYFQ